MAYKPSDIDYPYATCEELEARLGPKWAVVRRTPKMVARYGEDNVFLSQKAYNRISAECIAARKLMNGG
jgi:hypothetical protein